MKVLKSIERQVLTLLVAIFICSSAGYSFAMGERPNAEQQKAVNQMQQDQKFLNQPKCYEPLLITISSTTFSIPRDPLFSFTTKDGQTYKFMDHRCELKKLDNVLKAESPNLSFFDVGEDKEPMSGNKTLEEELQKRRENKQSILLPNGIEKTRVGSWYILKIPSSLINNYGDNPVIFNCRASDGELLTGTSHCTTAYLYKKDMRIAYTYSGFKKKYRLDDPVSPDQDIRKSIEGYLVRGE